MRPHILNRALDRGRAAALAHEEPLAERYRLALAQAGRIAARRFVASADASLTAAAPTAESAMVAVYPTLEQREALAQPNGEPAEVIHCTLAFLGELDADQAEAVAAVVAEVARQFEEGPLEGTVGGIAAFGSPSGMLAEIARIASMVAPEGGYGQTLWNFEEEAVLWIPADWTTDDEAEAAAQAFLSVPGVGSVVVLESESATPQGDDLLLLWSNGQAHVEASYPSIILPDVPGLAELRQAVCVALDEAGVPYAENHGWTPHCTLDYLSTPDPPPADLLGLPLTFGALSFAHGDVARDFPFGEAALVAAAPPPWNPPHPDEILDVDEVISRLRTKADPVRRAAIRAAALPALDEAHLDWDVTNPFVAGVLEKTASEVVGIAETTRLNVLRIIRDGYEQGLSIPDTAKAIREGMSAAAGSRATLIARTEMTGLASGGALAATQIVEQATGAGYMKQWLTAEGAKDPRHEDYDGLDGQTVALDDLFDVGGAKLAYPGDASGPPEEVCNCRCSLSFLTKDELGQEADGADLQDTASELAQTESLPISGEDAASLAASVVARAVAIEPKLTEIMRAVVEPRGGVLDGLAFRLKSEESMARKIRLVSDQASIPEKAAANAMMDGNRYTAVYGPNDFASKTRSTLDGLRRAGIEPERVTSRWAAGQPYVGTNVVLRAPNGVRFEVQFHTPESLRTKQAVNHALYEQWRKLDPGTAEAKRLERGMVANADSVMRPKGILGWKYEPSVEADVGITPFRGGLDDPIGFYDSSRFKAFQQDVTDAARKYGVEVQAQAKVAGVWEGEEEPAVALRVHDGELGVRAFAADLGKAYDQDGVLLFTAKGGEDVIATFGASGVPQAAPLAKIGALPRLIDPQSATTEQLLTAAEKKGLPSDIATRLHESAEVPKSLILNDRYDVSITKIDSKSPQDEYSLRYSPHQTPGIESIEGRGGRDALRVYYDPEVGQVGPHPIFKDRQTVTAKPDSGYLTWEQMKESYPNWDSASSEFVYRGMSAEEMAEVVRTGEIKSHGVYNIGKEQEGLTFFGTDASIANSYASSYAPVSMKATFDRPAFIVKVRRPAEDQLVLNPRLENEVGVKGSVPADQIIEVIEVRPYEVEEGVMELKAASPYEPASPYAQMGGNGGSGSYVYRSLGPLGGEVDRQGIFEAMADAGLPAGRFLEDGRLQVIGSGPEFVAKLDSLAARLRSGYDADVGEFRLLEKGNGDYEAALRDFGGSPGEQVRAGERAAEGDRGPAVVKPSAEGRQGGPPQVGVPAAPNVDAARTIPQPAVPPVPEPLTPAQAKSLSVDGLWKQAAELGKLENIARAEVADASQAAIHEALWQRGEGRLRKDLLHYRDLAGDQQVHSVFSDGHMEILDMAEEARLRGQRQLVISDHSHLLSPADIEAQHAEIDALNRSNLEEGVDFRVLKGIEVNILADGMLDTAPEVLAKFDVVNAAIHAPQQALAGQQVLFAESNTERFLKAMDNPSVTVLVHPHSVDADWNLIAKKAADKGIALEVNGRDLLRNDRQDAAAQMIAAAKVHGAKLAIGSDAHTSGDLVDVLYAVRFAAQHGVTPEDIYVGQRLVDQAGSSLPQSISVAQKTPGGFSLGQSKSLGGGMARVYKTEVGGQEFVVKIPRTQDELAEEFGMETGDRIRANVEPGLDIQREQAAYTMSRFFNEAGGDRYHVYTPPSARGEAVVPVGGRISSSESGGIPVYERAETVEAGIQGFIEGETAAESGGAFRAINDDRLTNGREEARSAALFDAVIGNTDRHAGNFLVGDDGHLWLIDHGLSFPEFEDAAGFQNQDIVNAAVAMFKKKLTPSEVSFLGRLLERWPEIEKALASDGLPSESVDEMKARVERMVEGRERRPWPHASDLPARSVPNTTEF